MKAAEHWSRDEMALRLRRVRQHEGTGDVIRDQHLSPIGVFASGHSCLDTEGPGFYRLCFFVGLLVAEKQKRELASLPVFRGH